MSIGSDLEDRLKALEMEKTSLKKCDLEDRLIVLETENALLKKYNEYHQVVHEINYMSDMDLDSGFYKQSMKLDNYVKIEEWFYSSIGQTAVIQKLDKKRPKLSNQNQTQNRRRYVNFENGSHFICSLNLNNPELTVCISFRMNNITSGDYPFLNSIISDNNGNTARFIAFYKTNSSLGLLISNSYGSFVTVANDNIGFVPPDYKFPSSKSNCTLLNKWHIISVTWSNRNSNCWSNGEKVMTFNTGNANGTDHCIIGDLGPKFVKSHLIGCIGEIIGFYGSLTDKETLYIHKYLMKKWGDTSIPSE